MKSTETCITRMRLNKRMGEEGFEPPKAFANRFTVCPDWPLRHSPRIQLWVAPEVEREFTHVNAKGQPEKGVRTERASSRD